MCVLSFLRVMKSSLVLVVWKNFKNFVFILNVFLDIFVPSGYSESV